MYINITRADSDYKNITLIKSDYKNIMLIVPTTHATGTEVTPYIQVQQILHMVKTTHATVLVTFPSGEELTVLAQYKGTWGKGDKATEKDGFYGQIPNTVVNGKIVKGSFMVYENQ